MLYKELKNEMLKSLLIEVNDDTAYRVHQAVFSFGLNNGLSNQDSYNLANDIIYTAKGKSLNELKEMVVKENKPPKRIEWTIGNGRHRLVPTEESRKLIFDKIIWYMRNTRFFKIYTSVDVFGGNYDSTEIEIHYDDGDYHDEKFDYDQEDKEYERLKWFIEQRLGLVVDEIAVWEDWSIDEDWGARTHYTTFIIGSAYTCK